MGMKYTKVASDALEKLTLNAGIICMPFATGSSDELVQRIMINVSAEFLSD